MSAFTGRKSKGEAQRHRERKRLAAEVRNALSRPERRKAARRQERAA